MSNEGKRGKIYLCCIGLLRRVYERERERERERE